MKIYREETLVLENVQDVTALMGMIERYLKVESATLVSPLSLSLIEPGETCTVKVKRWIGNIE